jgi:cell division protease FtsH
MRYPLSVVLALTLTLLSPGASAYAALARAATAARLPARSGVPGGALTQIPHMRLQPLALNAPVLTTLPDAVLNPSLSVAQVMPLKPTSALRAQLATQQVPQVQALSHAIAVRGAAQPQSLGQRLAALAAPVTKFTANMTQMSPGQLKAGADKLFSGALRHDDSLPTEPDTSSAPGPENEPDPAVTFTGPVPVARIVFELEELAKEDKEAAYDRAEEIMLAASRQEELRPEVLTAAMNFFATYPDGDRMLPMLGDILFFVRPEQKNGLGYTRGVFRAKALRTWQEGDTWWAFRREAARIIKIKAAGLSEENKSKAAGLLKNAWDGDLNPSVRLMAKDALGELGFTDIGAERHAPKVETPGPSKMSEPRSENVDATTETEAEKVPDTFLGRLKKDWNWKKTAYAVLAVLFLKWMLIGSPQQEAPSQPQIPQTEWSVSQIQNSDLHEERKQVLLKLRYAEEERERAKFADIENNRNLSAADQLFLREERRQSLALEDTKDTQEQILAAQKRAANSGGGVFSWIFQALIFAGIFVGISMFMQSKMQGGGGGGGGRGNPMNMFKKVQGSFVSTKPSDRFHDVAGIDEIVHEAQEIVDYLRNPSKYERIGGDPPKGMLMDGTPGVGKTALARAIAGESAASFFSISGSDFVEMYVGVGASRVRSLFAEAKSRRPAIIFIDEIDAIGKTRGNAKSPSGGNDEREQTLNQILAEMDGFAGDTGVVVIAATNRSDILDPALLRRFDKQVTVGKPDVLGRLAILQRHSRRVRLAPEADLPTIAEGTAGFSGSDLRDVIHNAARKTARLAMDAVSQGILSESIDVSMLGTERNMPLTPSDKRETAIHEAGHVMGALYGGVGRVSTKVTIQPRGKALGFADLRDDRERFSYKEPELRAQIVELLGGYAAEYRELKTTTSGPSNDLERATNLARMMVEQLGMGGKEVGLAVSAATNEYAGRPISEERARKVDAAIEQIISEALGKMTDILEQQPEVHAALVEALMRKETLGRDEIYAIKAAYERPAPKS